MLLETIKAFITRFVNYDVLTEQPQSSPSPGTAPGAGSGSSTGTGAYADNAPETLARPAREAPAFLQNAHDFVFNNHSTLISQVVHSGGTVLQLLGEKRISGAEVHSLARDPPPKCHPDTRKSLRGRITAWLSNANRDWRMFWVIGPMGVGKSAVAQTIAEETKETCQLGAALFFSRSNHRDDPDGVIATLAYQLAVKSPEYKSIITQRLVDNPTILENSRRAQFKELIIEPFQILMTQRPHIVQTPLLIILDGLDECRSKEAQCEFIELISDHVRQVDQFPLLWMICSRPEWHLKGLLSHPDFQVTCRREEMVIDDVEAKEDVTLVLREGFRDIHRKYRDYLEPDWPLEADLRRISTSASGHFAFATTMLKYVGDPQHANPRAQLQTCIRFLGGSGMPGAMNPLHGLDLLYRQVLSDVPKEILETTMCILGQITLYWGYQLTVLEQANFLCIDQPTFYRSLQHLHSVLDIPSATDAPRYELRFHHTSFKDFLLDPYRSSSFSIDRAALHYNIASLSLKWQNVLIDTTEKKHGTQSTNHTLEWFHPEIIEEKGFLVQLGDYSSAVCWTACHSVHEEDLPKLATQFEHFNFNGLRYSSRLTIPAFFPWLFKLANRLGAKPLMCQMRPDNSATQERARPLRYQFSVDILEEYLADFGPYLNIPLRTSEGGVILSFQLGEGDNMLELELVPMPYCANRSYTAEQSNEISLSEGEIVHVVDRTQGDWWYVRKEDGTEGNVPLEYIVGEFDSKYRARALYPYIANPNYTDEVSFSVGETMEVNDHRFDWWKVRKLDGTQGLAPSNFLVLYVSSEYKARASYDYTPDPLYDPFYDHDLSFEKGEIMDIIEPKWSGWWIARKPDGTVGTIPSNFILPNPQA